MLLEQDSPLKTEPKRNGYKFLFLLLTMMTPTMTKKNMKFWLKVEGGFP